MIKEFRCCDEEFSHCDDGFPRVILQFTFGVWKILPNSFSFVWFRCKGFICYIQEFTCVVKEFIFDVPEITCGDKRVSDPNMFSFGKKNLTDGLTCFTCDVNAC